MCGSVGLPCGWVVGSAGLPRGWEGVAPGGWCLGWAGGWALPDGELGVGGCEVDSSTQVTLVSAEWVMQMMSALRNDAVAELIELVQIVAMNMAEVLVLIPSDAGDACVGGVGDEDDQYAE